MDVLRTIGDGFWNAFQMFWEVWWALVLGFVLSGIVQAWVPRERMEQALGRRGAQQVALATLLGAASSSCSYAAVAIAKSLFQKGASFVASMAFQFASTNLVFELGIVMWVFLGWRFTLAEFVGGILLIVAMWGALRLVVTARMEHAARIQAERADAGHVHHVAATSGLTWRRRALSVDAWSDVAHNFRGDAQMLWREIGIGFLIAGFIALLPMSFFNGLFVTDAPTAPRVLENVVVGPLVAALSFVCSVGNIPLAAVLWAGGISFAGVIAFVYADLVIIPIVLIYRKYYGGALTARLVAVMLVAMIGAALVTDALFSAVGLVPTGRPSIDSIAARGIGWNYTSVLDLIFAVVAATLVALTLRRGAKDPVCGMTVDRRKATNVSVVDGHVVYFCGAGCKRKFDGGSVPADAVGHHR